MNLDFTKLNSLYSPAGRSEQEKEQPSKLPPEAVLEPIEQETYKNPCEDENASNGLAECLQELQRIANVSKAEKERASVICREYQENIKLSDQLQAEILKGAKQGENIYSLFLKAAQVISLMTSNTEFCSQLSDDVRSVYGVGLSEPKALELELQAVQERLQRLREVSRREDAAGSSWEIGKAIRAHEERAEYLMKLIA